MVDRYVNSRLLICIQASTTHARSHTNRNPKPANSNPNPKTRLHDTTGCKTSRTTGCIV